MWSFAATSAQRPKAAELLSTGPFKGGLSQIHVMTLFEVHITRAVPLHLEPATNNR